MVVRVVRVEGVVGRVVGGLEGVALLVERVEGVEAVVGKPDGVSFILPKMRLLKVFA